MEDSAIIELFFERSEDAIKETENKYGPYCRSVAYGILNNRQDAEECVNDTYKQLWDHIPPQKPDSLSAYLARITRNTALNRLKAANAEKRGSGEYQLVYEELEAVLCSANDVEEHFDEKRLSELISSFVKGLQTESRLVFIGRYWCFESISGIAQKTGFSESKVRSLLFRTRKKLKALVDKEGVI